MKRCPYTYPHRSKKARIEYLVAHQSYGGWNHPYRGWSPLAWNVKFHVRDWSGKEGDYKVCGLRDAEWDENAQNDVHLWMAIVEDMQRQYVEGEYCTYPGDDQGDWDFQFAGRSGGWMLLESWKPLTATYFLNCFNDSDGWKQWLEAKSASTVEVLYRAVRCMDADFTTEKIVKEFEYQLNFQRSQWEETLPPIEPCVQMIYEAQIAAGNPA